MQENEFYKKLVDRYVENRATKEDLEVFFHLVREGKLDEYLTEKMIQEISEGKIIELPPIRSISWWMRIAAASVILIIAVGTFYFTNIDSKDSLAVTSVGAQQTFIDAAPGGNRAILTLADGSTIILDSVGTGTLSHQGNSQIVKLDDGQLSYKEGQGAASKEILFNTITTPRGGQYQLTLSDGSRVWLNAESSIRFPASFTGKERRVEMTGEGYFEIAHNASKPFTVSAEGMEVEVLGTIFNVNAYKDEPEMKTTLLEGSVKVKRGIPSKIIKPGEQAQIINTNFGNDPVIQVSTVNIEEVIAWKNGLFYFSNSNIKAVMSQISRWYDVGVIYEESLPQRKFEGEIQRNLKLSQVLDLLRMNQINFDFDGTNITVKP